MKMFDNVSQKLRDSKKIVFVTGAGISQESGIPTFRGKKMVIGENMIL